MDLLQQCRQAQVRSKVSKVKYGKRMELLQECRKVRASLRQTFILFFRVACFEICIIIGIPVRTLVEIVSSQVVVRMRCHCLHQLDILPFPF